MARPLQVYLEENELARLDTWSKERGWTKSQAVRAAIRALTRPRDEDPILGASGMIDGLPDDMSENFDRYLQETFVAQAPPPRRKAERARSSVRR